MPKYILKIQDRYMGYSTITEKPHTAILRLEDLKEILKQQALEEFEYEWKQRIARVEAKGNSCFENFSNESIMSCNKAGPKGEELSLEGMIERYWWDYENEENNAGMFPNPEEDGDEE